MQEFNGNLLLDTYYKFDQHNKIVSFNKNDYKKIIDNKNPIKICFPYGINGIISDIYEYSFDKFDLYNLIQIIKQFYNSELTKKEYKKINKEAEVNLENLKIKNRIDILKVTNKCFIEELTYNNDVYSLRLGS